MNTILTLCATILLSGPAIVSAAPVHMPGQIGVLPMLLTTDVAVSQLSLSPSQQASVAALRSAFLDSARGIVADARKNPATQARAQRELDNLRSTTNRKALALLTPAQKTGLAKLEHDYLGAGLLFLPDVQSALGLSASQTDRISTLGSEWAAAIQAVNTRFNRGEITAHKRRALLRSDRESRNKKLLGVLNPSQKQAFQAMGSLPEI